MARKKPIVSRKEKQEIEKINSATIEQLEIFHNEIRDTKEYNLLTHNQKKFLHEYFLQPLTNKSNMQLYLDSYGEKPDGVPYNSNSYGQIINSPRVKPLLEKIKQIHENQLIATTKKVLVEENALAFSDICQYINKKGQLTCQPKKLPLIIRKAIKKIRTINHKNGNITYEIELWDKGKALQRIENILGLEKHNVTITDKTKQKSPSYDFSLLSYNEKLQLKTLLNKCSTIQKANKHNELSGNKFITQ